MAVKACSGSTRGASVASTKRAEDDESPITSQKPGGCVHTAQGARDLNYNWDRPPSAWERFGKIIVIITMGTCAAAVALTALPIG